MFPDKLYNFLQNEFSDLIEQETLNEFHEALLPVIQEMIADTPNNRTVYGTTPAMLDVTAQKHVEVEISSDGTVLWVNTDAGCRLRISQITNPITIIDNRR